METFLISLPKYQTINTPVILRFKVLMAMVLYHITEELDGRVDIKPGDQFRFD